MPGTTCSFGTSVKQWQGKNLCPRSTVTFTSYTLSKVVKYKHENKRKPKDMANGW